MKQLYISFLIVYNGILLKGVLRVKMANQDIFQELFELEPEMAEIYDLYRQTKEIYNRTLAAIGRTPTYNITFSNTKEVIISNGTSYSTKVYTSK